VQRAASSKAMPKFIGRFNSEIATNLARITVRPMLLQIETESVYIVSEDVKRECAQPGTSEGVPDW
jgi:hypothetical protein